MKALIRWYMAKRLSPGGFALWMAMGRDEEWRVTRVGVQHMQHRIMSFETGARAPWWGRVFIASWVFYFVFDTEDVNFHFLYLHERGILFNRAKRLRRRLVRADRAKNALAHVSEFRQRNLSAFAKLLVNEDVK